MWRLFESDAVRPNSLVESYVVWCDRGFTLLAFAEAFRLAVLSFVGRDQRCTNVPLPHNTVPVITRLAAHRMCKHSEI